MRIVCSTKVSDDRNRSSRCNALQASENSISKVQPLQVTARAKEAVARHGYRGDRHPNESAAAGNRLTSLRLEEASYARPNGFRAARGGSLGGVRISKRMDRAVITGHYPLTCHNTMLQAMASPVTAGKSIWISCLPISSPHLLVSRPGCEPQLLAGDRTMDDWRPGEPQFFVCGSLHSANLVQRWHNVPC